MRQDWHGCCVVCCREISYGNRSSFAMARNKRRLLVLGRDKLRMAKPQPLDGECVLDCDHRGLWHRVATSCCCVLFFD